MSSTGSVTISRIELPTHLPVGTVNAHLAVAGDKNVLIDSGIHLEDCREALVAQLGSLGVQPGQIDAVVLTHGHVDHTGWAQWFRAQQVPVYAHPGVSGWLDPEGAWWRYRSEFDRALFHSMGMPVADQAVAQRMADLLHRLTDRSVVDVALKAGEPFLHLPGFEVLYVPGHAQAAVALWNPETGELIGGDQVLPHISSNAVVEPVPGAKTGRDAARTKSLLQYRENLQQLRQLGIRTVYPGHGPVFGDVDALLDRRLAEQDQRRAEVLSLLRRLGTPSAYDLATAYFPGRTDQPSLILSEVIGFLDWLEADGEVECAADGHGVWHWQARH